MAKEKLEPAAAYEEALRRVKAAAAEKATELDLSELGLEMLPASIGSLVVLQGLDLSYNRLTTLPAWIRRLTRLRSLDLHNNQLTSLPPQIGRLVELQ